jgi:hypothetical protein
MAADDQDNHDRVFSWLGGDRQGTPYHLHPLNLVWSVDGVDHDLNVYRKTADLLAHDPKYTRAETWLAIRGCQRWNRAWEPRRDPPAADLSNTGLPDSAESP